MGMQMFGGAYVSPSDSWITFDFFGSAFSTVYSSFLCDFTFDAPFALSKADKCLADFIQNWRQLDRGCVGLDAGSRRVASRGRGFGVRSLCRIDLLDALVCGYQVRFSPSQRGWLYIQRTDRVMSTT